MDGLWEIKETRFDPATARAYEGLFTQGAGFLHVRGSIEEHLYDAPQNLDYTRRPANVTAEQFLETKAKWGTYVPGIRGNHPLLNRGLVNLPYFLDLVPFVGEEKLDIEASLIADYQRELDLRTATLRRSFRWQTRSGVNLRVEFERFLSAAHPGLCLQRMLLRPVEDVVIKLLAGIDGDVRTSGFDMFTNFNLVREGPDGIRCSVQTNTGDQVRIVSRMVSPAIEWQYLPGSRSAILRTDISIPSGTTLEVEKRTAVTSSFNPDILDPSEVLSATKGMSYVEIFRQHAEVWETRWQRSDVIVEGDDLSQLALRTSIYHLLRAHPDDPRLAIDPKAYAGDAYRGCYFWDTEMYLLPFFLYTDPPRAHSLVMYRVSSLPGARLNAAQTGYSGARYAWEADIDGTETCPNWQYRDHEVHVTADVVYALAHYAKVCQEKEFLTGPAGAVILETARYWIDRIDWRKGEDYPSLLGVMGPDEYAPICSNNSFTNRMVAFALALAADLGSSIGASPEEVVQFQNVAAGLPVLRSQEGRLILQCEEFEKLAEPAFQRFWHDRSRPYATQVTQEWLYRSKCLKQADVLLLMMLYPQEFSEDEVRTAWDYYLPYTTHDSSLSAGVHAIVACRLGKSQEAWEFWQKSSLNDLDFSHGGAAEGIHIAGAGLNWQMAVFGFAGLSTAMNSETLHLEPRLPRAWSRLAFPLVWKDCPVWIDIHREEISIINQSRQAMRVKVYDQEYTIQPEANVKVNTIQEGEGCENW